MHLVFIQTGGTIDKDYPRSTGGWAFEFGEPATTRLLERWQPSFRHTIVTACQKDSLEITDEDRAKMLVCLKDHPADGYIITHGTDTLIETAQYLARHWRGSPVVLTGAMRPERFSNSDAPMNLGTAVAALQMTPSGIYVAMHGIVKPHHQIKRNPETGQFY